MAIQGQRNEFIGGHVTKEEKELARQTARKEGGMSKWLHRLIRRELMSKGHDLRPEAK